MGKSAVSALTSFFIQYSIFNALKEHVESKVMVDSKATAGARALCAWLRRCRISVGEAQGDAFVKLLEAVVESVLLYGAEVWECCKRTDALEQVQLRAARILLGVGRRHPRVALQYEMVMLPLEWEARGRCVRVLGEDDENGGEKDC